MTFLRHAPRHVLHTVANSIEAALDELGWTSDDPAERPFGGTQCVVRRTTDVADGKGSALAAGTIAISMGNEMAPEDLELGGPLASQDYPIFIDILMDEDALALAVASDIRDHLLGRFDFSTRRLDVIDQITMSPAPGWRIGLEDVERVRPENDFTLHWQVVKVTAEVEFQEERY